MSKGFNNLKKLNESKTAASELIDDSKATKKMTFDLDSELHKVLKKYHKETGITMGFLLNEATKDLLRKKNLL